MLLSCLHDDVFLVTAVARCTYKNIPKGCKQVAAAFRFSLHDVLLILFLCLLRVYERVGVVWIFDRSDLNMYGPGGGGGGGGSRPFIVSFKSSLQLPKFVIG